MKPPLTRTSAAIWPDRCWKCGQPTLAKHAICQAHALALEERAVEHRRREQRRGHRTQHGSTAIPPVSEAA